ncbi:MAG: blue light receptor [Thelocarpon superellum]|nr:MAG: blue light receptor [Thelocarpon superellum]
MSGMLEQSGDLLDGLGLDMMPMHLDVALDETIDRPGFSATTAEDNASHLATHEGTSDAMQASSNGTTTGVGDGPLPTGFGTQANVGGGSTLTEFTKRRNWSRRVLEELRDFLHILTPDGRVLYASPSAKAITGYDHDDLMGKFIVDFIHPDDSSIFVREFHESIATGNPLRFFYRFRKADGTYAIFESHGHPHLTSEAAAFGPNNAGGFCRGFFMMARPYPAKNAALLDSFLEHKIENERLTKRIADLKREEQEEAENQQRPWLKKQEGQGSLTPSETQPTESETPGSHSMTSAQSNDFHAMPPPAKPGTSNTALTRQNLDEANAFSKPDSINDKMARYEGATHIETIEMLTGLRYRDGERSQGISTGDASPALIRGDAGIAITVDKDNRTGSDKKKKLKVADEYVCTDCVRWAKKEKKRNNSTGGGGGNGNGSGSGSGATNSATASGGLTATTSGMRDGAEQGASLQMQIGSAAA